MSKLKEKIGFIGCGNMGGAILEGLLKNRITKSSQIFVFDPYPKTLSRIRRQFHVRVCSSNQEVIQKSQIVILAIKPQELHGLANAFKLARAGQTVITILAGTPIQKIKKLIRSNVLIARAMPNLGAKVGASMTAVTGNAHAVRKVETIFSGCGEVIRVSEKYMDLVTAVSGSGPAYFFLFMEILETFAKKYGISKKDARLLAVQTALGASKLADNDKNQSLKMLRQRVTSKGGTTEAALTSKFVRVSFEKLVPMIFENALKHAIKRAKELSRG